jgi:hypothetical protein
LVKSNIWLSISLNISRISLKIKALLGSVTTDPVQKSDTIADCTFIKTGMYSVQTKLSFRVWKIHIGSRV